MPDIELLLSQLTLEEKVSLLAGADMWHTNPIERLGIPVLKVTDGPNGARGTEETMGSLHHRQFRRNCTAPCSRCRSGSV